MDGVSQFLSALPDELRPLWEGKADSLPALLDALGEEVVRRYALDPSRVSREILARCIARRLPPGAASIPATLHVADAYLADACAEADDAALRAFDAALAGELDRAVARSPALGLSPQDFRQMFRERCFVARPGASARVASYAATGPLRAWVRVAAARLIVDLARKPHTPEPVADEELIRLLPNTGDPELRYLRLAYAEKLPAAFARAVQRLSVRQRNLLRQRYLYGVGGAGLARLYGIHRATVFVWLETARKELLAHLRETLTAELPDQHLESVVALLGSALEISVRRLLDSRLEAEP